VLWTQLEVTNQDKLNDHCTAASEKQVRIVLISSRQS
jgi:hypothetical protein